MHPVRTGLAIGALALLAACFMSETPFIPDSEAVRLGDGPILVCSDDDDCGRTIPNESDNGYLMMPPPGEKDPPLPIKFAPLMDTAIGPIWLAEIDMTEEDERAYVVGVVRRAPEFDADGLEAYDVALPDCDDVTEEDAVTFGIGKLDHYTCALPTETSISEYLRQTHQDEFEDPDWWEDH